MSRLNANQIRSLLGSSEFDISCEEEDHYVVLWPGPGSPIRIDLRVADDPDTEEWATMLLAAEKVMTIALSHPHATLIYHELLAQAINSSELCVKFHAPTGAVSFVTASCTPLDGGFEAANLSAVEATIARFATAVVRLYEQVFAAAITGKPRHVRDADRLDKKITALFDSCCDEFPACPAANSAT